MAPMDRPDDGPADFLTFDHDRWLEPTRSCRRPSSRRLARSRVNHPATSARELAVHPRLLQPIRHRRRCAA